MSEDGGELLRKLLAHVEGVTYYWTSGKTILIQDVTNSDRVHIKIEEI